MHIFAKLTHVVLALAGTTAAIVVGCGAPRESAPPEAVDSTSEAICYTCSSSGDGDPCTPSCTGKTCGASDGCGGICRSGSCPAGQTCGGGGVVGQCGCTPSCSGKACGAPDGCGGICTSGTCGYGQGCGAGGVPGVCATLPIGTGVECFVFDDGYANMAGPTTALYFPDYSTQVCMPDSGPTGTCRKWFGRCRTTDPSHTPVMFTVFDDNRTNVAGPSDAVYSRGPYTACVPDGTSTGACHKWFGAAKLPDGRPIGWRLFDDGGQNMTSFTREDIYNFGLWEYPDVCIDGGGLCRKWFGNGMVIGCGDGVCNNGETHATCPADCKCGDGACNNGETCSSCPTDCGVCPFCGDHVCNNGETCSSCPGDCGSCPVPTCSGQTAGPQATTYNLVVEDLQSCFSTQAYYANTLAEATQCAQNAGYSVVTSGTFSQYTFHTDPTYGCASTTFGSLSSSEAASCALAHGYAYEGPCP